MQDSSSEARVVGESLARLDGETGGVEASTAVEGRLDDLAGGNGEGWLDTRTVIASLERVSLCTESKSIVRSSLPSVFIPKPPDHLAQFSTSL